MKCVVVLPDIGRHQPRHRFPIRLEKLFVARQAATEKMDVAPLDITRSHHLLHLLKRVVIADEDKRPAVKPNLQHPRAGQDDALAVNRVKKIIIPALVPAQGIESSRSQMPTQFSQRRISCKAQCRCHDNGGAGIKRLSSKRASTS